MIASKRLIIAQSWCAGCLYWAVDDSTSSTHEPHLHFIYSYHISEPLLEYPFNYFPAMLRKLNTTVTST